MSDTPNIQFSLPRRLALQVGVTVTLASSTGRGFAAVPSALAPDFTLRTIGGPNIRLQEQRGKVVLINFWATWCGPCRQEMPQLNKLYEKYRNAGFNVLGINVDDDSNRAVALASRAGLKFPLLLDTDKTVSRLYDINTMPTTVLVDRDGRVRHTHNGYVPGMEDVYEKQMRELLK